jgi:hypothetical protein
MSKFNDNGFFIEKEKVYKYINSQKRLIVLLKPNYCEISFDMNGTEFDMEDTNNLLNAELVKFIIDKSKCNLEDINKYPNIVKDISEGLDLYAIDISKIWNFQNYDSWIDIIYYSGIDKETNQLIY